MKSRIKINGIIIFITFLLIVIFHGIFLRKPSLSALEILVRICGLAMVILGQVIRVSARGFKAQNSKQGGALLQTGPYALTRNPMYLGILCIGLGIVIMFFNWWVGLVFVFVFLQRYMTLMIEEEKKLGALFAGEYADYKKRVPRFFPSIINLFKNSPRNYLPLKKAWFKKEVNAILGVLSAIIIIWVWECFW
jgi:protein-S-isoprenylcysteine O-methyltransferase Ste14